MTWSNCSQDCAGIVIRRRECVPPQNRGLHCSELPDSSPASLVIDVCPQDGCLAPMTCPSDLEHKPCAPCPLTCSDLSNKKACHRDAPCVPGCWCPEGLLLDALNRCVRPEECPCEVDGVVYWPGQPVKTNCQICTCQDGQLKQCQPNPECAVHCGWSAWSPWGDCLGPCGVQSIQWSFRSPNNPSKHGNGKQCRGIYRKARRCQTEPCESCSHQGKTHNIGERWRSGECHVCQCLPNLTVQCSHFCQYTNIGCPPGQVLVPESGDSCCYCSGTAPNRTDEPPAHPTSQPPNTPVPELITYTLPAAEDGCYRPLRISSLPDTSFTASSQRTRHPAQAGRLNHISSGTDLQGWSPEAEEYQAPASRPSYLQIDLLQPWNLTGIVVQGSGASAAFVTSFLVQFSEDQRNWHAYQELNGDQELQPKVFTGNSDGSTPVARSFERMVMARYVRIVPQTFHSGIFLRTELLGCGEVPKDSPFLPTKQKPPEELCQPGQFQCHNGHCVPAGAYGVVCNGVNDCGDQSDEIYCGTAPSPLSPARWGCQRSQFYCKASGVCIEVSQRCDGLPDCSDAADEMGCVAGITFTTPTIVSFSVNQEISPGVRPPGAETPARPHAPTSHPVPLAPLTKPGPQGTDRNKTPGDIAPAGPCDGSLGLEDGRIRYQQLTASSSKENNPPDAGRLNIVPNILNIGPGWSPLSTDKQPYFQVDFLQPTFISGVIVQGGRQSGGFVTKFRLLYSNDGLAFNNYTGEERGATARSEVFVGNSDSNTPVRRDLARLVLARYLRLLPVAYNKAIYLRSEILGCPHVQPTSSPGHETETRPSSMVTFPGASQPSRCRHGEFECRSGECVNASSALCDGRYDCPDYSDEEGCGTNPFPEAVTDVNTPVWSLGTAITRLSPEGPRGEVTTAKTQTDTATPGSVPELGSRLPGTYKPGDTGEPGLHFLSKPTGSPGMLSVKPGHTPTHMISIPGEPGLQEEHQVSGKPGILVPERPEHRVEPGQSVTGSPAYGKYSFSPFGSEWTFATMGTTVSPENKTPLLAAITSSQWETTGGSPGVNSGRYPTGIPGLATQFPGTSVELSDSPRKLCRLDQFACSVFGCVDSTFVCDGQEDCIDGSDELLCGTASTYTLSTPPSAWSPVTPHPSTCSSKQLICASGECFSLEKRCDLQKDCADGSDEINCVDCILSPWTWWSECSRSCGLGVTFRRRDVVRDRLPGGHCDGAQFDSRSCFVQACPVHGAWSHWSEWSPCDAECQGGVRFRRRSCEDPPPKNGGRPCPGESVQAEPCNLQPCGESQDCGPEMIYVDSAQCDPEQPCPRTCRGLNSQLVCGGGCMEGCRCPLGLYLQDGVCINITQCRCHTEQGSRLPEENFSHDNCSACQCQDGKVTCDDSACVVPCGWSAWSHWTPCDQTCGVGMQERFRSPSNPPSSNGGAPCEGDSREVHECYSPCANETDGQWTEWTPWSSCSVTCFYDVEHIGVRRRFRYCNNSLSNPDSPCVGESMQEEPCDTQLCPVIGSWSHWSSWIECSASCDSGIQTRNRTCSRPFPTHGGSDCQGPQIQTRECNPQPCKDLCPPGMIYQTEEECRSGGGACPRLCLDQAAQVECASSCYEGCYCPHGLFLQNSSCVPQRECSCYYRGDLYQPGDSITLDACNNCTCQAGDMVCGTQPCQVHCGWSSWTSWSSCSRTCNVGTRRRYRSGTNPPAAFGGRQCEGSNVAIEFCSLQPCTAPPGIWGPWSECSVPCGGGYRNRSLLSVVLRRIEFSTCNVQPCPGEVPGVCLDSKVWRECSDGPSTCASLQTFNGTTCQPGCYCQDGEVLLNNQCVPVSVCPCTEDGELYQPGDPVSRDCNNCTCVSGEITNCTQLPCDAVDGNWSEWTPWSECSVTCGGGFQSRFRFCTDPPLSGFGSECEGLDHEEIPCNLEICPESGHWSEWVSWTECSKSCGEGLRSRTRMCNRPEPLGDGDYCEGPGADTESCHLTTCPASNCSDIAGSVFSPCGPSCPRSCDDIVLCTWRCQPGCYCPAGQILNSNGTGCLDPQDCTCLDLLSGQRYLPGESAPRGDGCNSCTCVNGTMICTSQLCVVPGGWCKWSDWTPCSRTCGVELVTRYRSCSCPKPQRGGSECEGVQKFYGDVGVQLETRGCPSPSFCPVDGVWGSWSPWSPCDVCAGESVRTRRCDNPPARFGGVPCDGEDRQTQTCQDNSTQCSDCGGGQVDFACGKPCPRSCEDLHGDTMCLDPEQCQPSCGCPDGLLVQAETCVEPRDCNCKYRRQPAEDSNQSNSSSWSGPEPWQYVLPGDTVSGPCQNCTCSGGRLLCSVDPHCVLDGGWGLWSPWSSCSVTCGEGIQTQFRTCDNPASQNGGRACRGEDRQERVCHKPECPDSAPWSQWSSWSACSVSCGGGEQIRVRECHREECHGKALQSKVCNNQVCLDVGCPPDRLYRECGQGDGCPYSCAHLTQQVDCFPDGCEEGCHCPVGTLFHNGSCVTDCPCVITEDTMQSLKSHFMNPHVPPSMFTSSGFQLVMGDEVLPGEKVHHECSTCTCEDGRMNCSFTSCPVDGGFSIWSPWSPCSMSCGGLGNMTRSRECTNPAPASGGAMCEGPSIDLKYCLTQECQNVTGPSSEPPTDGTGPEEEFGPWSPWTPCSKTCTDIEFPAVKTRSRFCQRERNCIGESFQEQECNLPQCTDGSPCVGENCTQRNCTWNDWSEWSECSRSCGVGQQRRLRTYNPPGENGLWCEDILSGNMERRFCNLQACKVDGSWSKWSPWSWCDRTCGGGRSVRSRTCSSPPPKNGGKDCTGEQYHVRICNPNPCGESCPPGMEYVECANRCPRHCSDFQQGIQCQDGEVCEAGCRCPPGLLEQDSMCVPASHCECMDPRGQSWMPGSSFMENCNNCTCEAGHVLCTNHTCPGEQCSRSQWSLWSQCSVTCGGGHQTQFRSFSGPSGKECRTPELQTRPCHQGTCPQLCPHNRMEKRVGDMWLVGECQQCICTPEGNVCQDMECRVDGKWTPWSPWSDCPVTCGEAAQIRTRACINPPPRNNGSDCEGAERELQECTTQPCTGGDTCDWSEWTPCSRTCSTGIRSRTWRCDCLTPDLPDSPCNTSVRVQTEACYMQPCTGICTWGPWSEWSACSCHSLLQHRHRELQTPSFEGDPCEPVGAEVRTCNLSDCSESSCQPPFQFSSCGSPCDGLCSSLQNPESCHEAPGCQPGCYCPEGTLEQNGECVPPSECGCHYVTQAGNQGPPNTTIIPPGHTVRMGCQECFCQQGALQCTRKNCQGSASVSEWSEWSPCSPCLPSHFLDLLLPYGTQPPPFSSIQQRHRVCLNARTGFLWSGSALACSGELTQERLCPDRSFCADLCAWSVWGEWSACREPCSGGFRVRWRHVHHPAGSKSCEGPRFQSESCNTAACPGEECEDRGKAFKTSCANQCPRACTDLWEHVECLQGQCRTGCRCPQGWLLQDRLCVPVSECRCSLPTANATIDYHPGDTVHIDCNNCTCVNGTFICTLLLCPSYGPWSDWDRCSASCGEGHRQRNRTCSQRNSDGEPCGMDTVEVEVCNNEPCPGPCVLSEWTDWSECSSSCGGGVSERSRTVIMSADPGGQKCNPQLLLHRSCNMQSCTPGCPEGQVYGDCANSCPRLCSDLQPQTDCVEEVCEPGCACPPGMVLQGAECVNPENCPCSFHSSSNMPWARNLTQEEQTQEYPAGTVIYHECNNCTCNMGAFTCTAETCKVDCRWSQWTEWSLCSATCGTGIQISQRHQTQQRLYDGKECEGTATRQRICIQPDCSCPEAERWIKASPEDEFCERTCQEVYEEPIRRCWAAGFEGCVCEAGTYRSSGGTCLTAAHCECEHEGLIHRPGTEWQDGCETCRCVNGLRVCSAGCPPLHCLENEAKVQEPGECCPVCRTQITDETSPLCQLHTELRNITKAGCRQDRVEVSFCRGRCMSWTHVLPEEPYLQTVCDCCSYRLDPVNPVQILNLECEDGEVEPVVLPVIHSCECSSCQGGDLSRR